MPLESYLLIHQDAKLTPEQNKTTGVFHFHQRSNCHDEQSNG